MFRMFKGNLSWSVIVWLTAAFPVLFICGMLALGLGVSAGMYAGIVRDLPDLPNLKAYKPKTVSIFYADDGTRIGMFYNEKRFPISVSTLPPHVTAAFVSAEDARFFSHSGIDYFGLVRAAIKNLQAGEFAQGGSTITQQVTRSLLLSKEKKITRKIRELLLSAKLEKTLSKDEILEIYLNEIYLGRGSYGIEAAAETYFGKSAGHLTIAESAYLASLVPNPSRYSSSPNSRASLNRRRLVLGRMLKWKAISETEYETAVSERSTVLPRSSDVVKVPYFTETVRQYIVDKYGQEALYNGGLQVFTTCSLSMQRAASESLLKGVHSWEKRQGRPAGLTSRLSRAEAKEFLAGAPGHYKIGGRIQGLIVSSAGRGQSDTYDCVAALPGNLKSKVRLNSALPYRQNDLVGFKVVGTEKWHPVLVHEGLPHVEGAVVVIENRTGYVRAVEGGLDFDRSNFNRAGQARRQPGSSFKPVVYSAAMEKGRYGPNTLLVDEPISVLIDPEQPEWIPVNSDGRYYGAMTLRKALVQSRNIVTVKLLMDIGPDNALDIAKQMGIQSPLGANLSLALGAAEVTPLELTSAYTVFPNMGMRIDPVLVKKVVDRNGKVLEDNSTPPLELSTVIEADDDSTGGVDGPQQVSEEPRSSSGADIQRKFKRVLSPKTAYLMLSILHDVCVHGTASAVSGLKRKDLGGKTGTSNECTDAWFIGFNPKYTAGVWIGHDTKKSVGDGEYGARAALPVWMDLMKQALKDEPQEGYPIPDGVLFDRDPTGHDGDPAFLTLNPDLPDHERKATSPLDTKKIVDLSKYLNPTTGRRLTKSYGNSYFYEGAVRVLSVTGDTLGFSAYSRDADENLLAVRPAGYAGSNGSGYYARGNDNPQAIQEKQPQEGTRSGTPSWDYSGYRW